MVTHRNPSITERALRILNTKTGDHLSDEVNGPVVVIPIKPVTTVLGSATRAVTATGNIFTTQTGKDTYITGICFSVAKDAACDATTSDHAAISATINGSSVTLARIAGITLTAFAQSIFMSFPEPIKVDSGTTVTVGGMAFTAGSCVKAVVIHGYTEEVTRT